MIEAKAKPVTRPHEPVLGAFEAFERGGQGNGPSWLQALHKGGIAHFAELGFPTTDHEEWRFTNVTPIARTAWSLAESPRKVSEKELGLLLFPGVHGKRVVFVDGYFSKELSSKDLTGGPQSLRIQNVHDAVRSASPLLAQSLARYARYDENSFVALNTAFVRDGAVIMAPSRTQLRA